MALLRRLRDRGGGLIRAELSRVALFLAVALLPVGCKAPPELRPDELLKDSLGLTDRDRVHRVELRFRVGTEHPEPAETLLRPGDYLAFRNRDRRARTIHFDTAGLGPEARAWLRGAGGGAAPLLTDLDQRWILSFEGAPPGRYPFTVVGGGETGGGAVTVEAR